MSANPDLGPADPAQTVEIRKLLDRAQKGDSSVLPQLQEILDNNPKVWRLAGDLALHVQTALLDLACGKDMLTRESIKRRLGELKAELAGSDPSPLERLLTDRIALEWLFLHVADRAALRTDPADQFLPLHAKFREEKRDLAHRRFLRSIKVLADVRRLLRPKAAPLDIARMTEGGRVPDHPLPWPSPSGQRGRVHGRSVSCID